MRIKKALLIINIFFLISLIYSCEKKTRMVDIKLLILTPDNFFNFPVVLNGKINDIGPGGLWFILEDKTGYIQVTTENIPSHISCVQKGKNVSILGKLSIYENHKYFTFSSLLRCSN
ncbi:OB-fold nucleic acid binding domain-containing protein [Silvanigrella aquatica]|uniref:OB domain-containing protein n=1 Tax=Silvanigrella aquatica TaxID=1915309 RepID=A0A1L4D0Y7_9BACT|nr:OB-fold nucleic acid binding domain-containing protein [Silvanigrella aquatica]APJ03861.1 hypothetical protein AXG55_08055 [Silvanigrella aquatica]